MREKEEVALVTGGGSGIGRAVCLRLAAEGMALGAADKDPASAKETADAIRRAGGRALDIGVDISKQVEVDAMFDALLQTYGKLNYLAANAGIYQCGDFLALSPDQWQTVMDVNVHGTLMCCQRAAKEMMRQGAEKGDRSILIALSQNAAAQNPWESACTTASWTQRGLMRSLAMAMAPHDITVNAIGVGRVDTPMAREAALRLKHRGGALSDTHRGEAQPAEEIAALYRFAFSREAHNITGMTFLDNGGETML